MDAKKRPISVSLDKSTAFDTINLKIIIHKLSQYRSDGKFPLFSKSYNLDRQQQLVISHFTSNFVNVTSGGPQGSVFAGLLFSVYIKDLTEVFLNECFLFADDTKVVGYLIHQPILPTDNDSAINWS